MRLGLALAALLLAPTASAEGQPTPFSLEVASARSVSAWGDVRLRADEGLVDLTNETPRGTVAIRWAAARGYDVTERKEGVPSTDVKYAFENPTNLTLDLGPGELRVRGCLAPCEVALVVLPGSSLLVEGLPDGPLARSEAWTFYHGYRDAGRDSFRAHVGDGWVEAPLAGASFEARGTLVLFLNGPVGEFALRDGADPFWTGFRRTASQGLLGVPATEQDEHRFVALVLEGAEAVGAGLAEGRVDAPRARVEAAERVEVRDATGALRYGAIRRQLEGADVVVHGASSGPLASAAVDAPWRGALAGSATAVTLDAATVRPLPPSTDAATLLARLVALLVLALLLAKACLWALYSRLGAREVLDNANRLRVYRALEETPGSRPAELARATGIHEAVVRYHLRRLREAGLAGAEELADATLWFAKGTAASPSLDRVLAQRGVRGETVRRLVDALLGFPGGATQGQVAAATGISRRLVSYHLQRLEEAALVTKRGGRPALFQPTQALLDALDAGRPE